MPGNTLVIVESPAKAKTINKYLGDSYTVVASYGHVRDLPAKDGSVRPDEDFAMDWSLADRGKKQVDAIAKAAKGADRVLLATDPDREGEAISWHVQESLKQRRGLSKLEFDRVTFNQITRDAVLDAIANPRALNQELIEAYLARRALDYLVGFTLSPVLWRKLPGSRSAGRVQSVALRLITDREAEIERFVPREYWSVLATFATDKGDKLAARLTHLDGKKLDKFSLGDEAAAKAAVAALEPLAYKVAKVERKEVRRRPAPPFTTSTLQQEASRKLGFGASQTMRVAQRLYEGVDIGGETVGLITYMRTDGLQLADEAIAATRATIAGKYGDRYVPDRPIIYKSTQKNAQEAHEAIRPTDPGRHPDSLKSMLAPDMHRLYTLIWRRTLACQMANAVMDQVSVDVAGDGNKAVLRATGSVVKFDGFLRVYEEGRDDTDDDDANQRLPDVQAEMPLTRNDTAASQHFTQPPPRFTEASLVKRMEELGIGRPSTYASILQVLQDREYVRLEKKRFLPEDRGRLVTAFLTSFFDRYVEFNFTARLEEQLDDISGGRLAWKEVLREFWEAFSAAIDGTKDLTITQVIDALDAALGPHFFPPKPDGSDPRLCPACSTGRLGLRLARKSGAFIGCSNYPECKFTRPLEVPTDGEDANGGAFPRDLGPHPDDDQMVSLRKGPFGIYVQHGNGDGDAKPKRVSLPKGLAPDEVDLETALKLLALPRDVGLHPETQQKIVAGIGRFGPYLRYQGAYRSLTEGDDVLSIGMNRAVELLATSKARPAAEPLRALGDHPTDGKPVAIFKGRYGPYVKHERLMASIPKSADPETFSLDDAVALLEAKAASGKGGSRKTATKAKTATKTTAKTKAGTKTAAAKKTAKAATGDTAAKAAEPAKKATTTAKSAAAKKSTKAADAPDGAAAKPTARKTRRAANDGAEKPTRTPRRRAES